MPRIRVDLMINSCVLDLFNNSNFYEMFSDVSCSLVELEYQIAIYHHFPLFSC